MGEVGTAIAAIVTLLLWALRQWLANAPKRKKEAEDEAAQKVRQAIASGDVATVNATSDELLSVGNMPTTGTAADSSGQQHSADSTAEGISDLLGTKTVFRE